MATGGARVMPARPVRQIPRDTRDRLIREAVALLDAATAPLDVVQADGDMALELVTALAGLLALCDEARADFGEIQRRIDAHEPLDHILAELWAAVDARQEAEADRYRRNASKAQRAAKRRGRDIAARVAESDATIQRLAVAFRNRYPHTRQHSTRALSAYLARTMNMPAPTVRRRLKALGIA
jgi:hypothetical protein